MLKKALFVGGALVLLLGLAFGRDACSYISTTVDRVQASVKSHIPPEVEIERARKMINSLQPEIRENMHRIAKEEVEVARLERQLGSQEKLLAKSEAEILRLNDDLKSDSSHYVYAGRTFSADQVRGDLANRFKHHKTVEATAQKLTKILEVRRNKLGAAREKLEAMLAAKRQLEVDVENLEARLEMIQVAQTTSEFQFDDSQLARTKELVSDIGTRLDVAEKLLNSHVELYDRIPLDDDGAHEDISSEIAQYFGENRIDVASVIENE